MADTTPTIEQLFHEALQRHPHPFGLLRHSEADRKWLAEIVCKQSGTSDTPNGGNGGKQGQSCVTSGVLG